MLLAGYLPFDDSNLTILYKKVSIVQFSSDTSLTVFCLPFIFNIFVQISSAEFTFPPWLSFGAMKLISRILDPNPMTVSNGPSTYSIDHCVATMES